MRGVGLSCWALAPAFLWAFPCSLSAFPGQVGEGPFQFLFADGAARPAGLGGAYAALGQDANALQYNPAGLGILRANEISLTHLAYVQNISMEQAAFALRRGWGLQAAYWRTPGAGDPSHLWAGLGFGRRAAPGLVVGGSGKYIQEARNGTAARAGALDLGAILAVRRLRGWSLGLALQNMGPKASASGETGREALPFQWRLGVARRFLFEEEPVLVAVEAVRRRGEDLRLHVGAEAKLAQAAVRLGWNGRHRPGPGVTAGLGWTLSFLTLDYAYAPFGDLGDTHRVTMTFRLGRQPSATATRRARPKDEPGGAGTARPEETEETAEGDSGDWAFSEPPAPAKPSRAAGRQGLGGRPYERVLGLESPQALRPVGAEREGASSGHAAGERIGGGQDREAASPGKPVGGALESPGPGSRYLSPKQLERMDVREKALDPSSEAEGAELKSLARAGGSPEAGLKAPPALSDLEGAIPSMEISDMSSVGAFHVQMAATPDFAKALFDRTYSIMDDYDIEGDARKAGLRGGSYWVRIALVDLLGFEQPFSQPRRYKLKRPW